MWERVRKRAGRLAIDSFFEGSARLGKLNPWAAPKRHGIEVIANVKYGELDAHRLDIYRPIERSGDLPVVLYVHGGGFRILSKDTHWLMALLFARRGYLVFNIDYRTAPPHPFPAALEDTSKAYAWAIDNAKSYGGDLDRLIFAGESAGANLVLALTVALCFERSESFARDAFAIGHLPNVVLPACGMLQVSNVERFNGKPHASFLIRDRMAEIRNYYLGDNHQPGSAELDLADPLVLLERGDRPARPLPPMLATVGTHDTLIDDTRRLEKALKRLDASCEALYYEGGMHAFHAFLWRKKARQCWRDTFDFLDRHLR